MACPSLCTKPRPAAPLLAGAALTLLQPPCSTRPTVHLLPCPLPAPQLGSRFHVAHGLANASLISHVLRYNATDRPYHQQAFPQYKWAPAPGLQLVAATCSCCCCRSSCCCL